MARVLVDGSSTTYGLWGGKEMGYADRMKSVFTTEPEAYNYATVVNFAAPLRTAVDIARDLPPNLSAHQVKSLARVGIYMLGLPDARQVNGEQGVTIDIFKEAVHEIGETSLEMGYKPIFLGPPPIDETRTADFGAEHATYTTDGRIAYDEVVQEYVAGQPGAEHIDLNSILTRQFPDTLEIIADDGLHPNDLGHAAITGIVLPVVTRSFKELKSRR